MTPQGTLKLYLFLCFFLMPSAGVVLQQPLRLFVISLLTSFVFSVITETSDWMLIDEYAQQLFQHHHHHPFARRARAPKKTRETFLCVTSLLLIPQLHAHAATSPARPPSPG